MSNLRFANWRARCAFVPVATLLVTALAQAQNITVTAANTSNNSIYDVTFSGTGGTTTVLNTDQALLHDVVSLAFYPNPATFQLDLLAAENPTGKIVRYSGDFRNGAPTSSTVVYATGSGPGPLYPDSLSVDAAGNLFATNSKQDQLQWFPEVWLLPANGAGGFGKPVLIDGHFICDHFVDTLIADRTLTPAGAAQPIVNPGDLLALTSHPATVLRYPGSNGHGPLGPVPPITLAVLPGNIEPEGFAFWPADGTLLVTSSDGTIYQLTLAPHSSPAKFAQGLGLGEFRIKTGTHSGLPYAYVTHSDDNQILEFGGPHQLLAKVTAAVSHPRGLAVSNINFAPLSSCQDQQTNGCDLLGGNVLTHDIPINLSLAGNVIEDICVVSVDPRLAQPGSSCTTSLPVATVCGGFSSTLVIPPSLCGASGPSGKGFALIRTLTQAYSTPNSFPFNGALIFNDSNLPNVLPPAPTNPVCNPSAPGTTPLGTLAWAPLAGEGKLVEGNSLLELTSGCDGGTSKSYGLSLFGIGFALNTSATGGLLSFASSKYVNVLATIQDEIGESVLPAPIASGSLPPDGNFTYQLQQCIETSQAAFAKGSNYYGGAALELLAADSQIAAVASLAAPFTPDGDYPNPSGALRSRLENMYYTVNTRVGGNQASSSPPSPPPPPPPPSISGTPQTTVKPGAAYSFQPTAADFAGNTGTLSYSIVGRPSWASFSSTTGQLSGTATEGSYPGIVISATDGCASASLPAFTITVKCDDDDDHGQPHNDGNNKNKSCKRHDHDHDHDYDHAHYPGS